MLNRRNVRLWVLRTITQMGNLVDANEKLRVIHRRTEDTIQNFPLHESIILSRRITEMHF